MKKGKFIRTGTEYATRRRGDGTIVASYMIITQIRPENTERERIIRRASFIPTHNRGL